MTTPLVAWCNEAAVTRPRTDPFDAPGPSAHDALARRVLDVVDAIPRGRVMSYGDIAAYVGCGPRQVARVMRERGDETPWWRVLRADGTCAPEVRVRQMKLLRGEAVVLRGRDRVDLRASRHTPDG